MLAGAGTGQSSHLRIPILSCAASQQRPGVALARSRPVPTTRAQLRNCAMLFEEKKDLVAKSIRGVPDFPKKGIQFWDITTLCLDPAAFRCCIEAFHERYKDQRVDAVAGTAPRRRSVAPASAGAPLAKSVLCRLRGTRFHFWTTSCISSQLCFCAPAKTRKATRYS